MNLDLLILIIIVYAILNCISLFLFYSDKKKAVDGNYRTRESTLLTAGFFGPFGAVFGMQTFRHKTKKSKFKLIYLFLILHIIGIILLILWMSDLIAF